ncbi:hypothetical protein [Sulfolobus tengchongensis spindle-shaped virus 3]|nr:hypothetical protein [Sulfolobus tengchongensis spindle-shaped virus 3]
MLLTRIATSDLLRCYITSTNLPKKQGSRILRSSFL